MKRSLSLSSVTVGLLLLVACSGASPAAKTTVPSRTDPIQISRVPPVYPESARKARLEGVVTVEAVINTYGNVESVRVLEGVDPLLDNAAMRAVQQWKYKPALEDGKPVAVKVTTKVTFSLQ